MIETRDAMLASPLENQNQKLKNKWLMENG